MSKNVPYVVQTIDHPNPVARFAHRSRYAHSLRLADRLAAPNATVLDFGAGTGEFLHMLHAQRPDLGLVAVEPIMPIQHDEVQKCRSLDEVDDASIDVICAFEVLEHLTAEQIDGFIAGARRVCRPGSKLIISVPIMEGIALPAKELSRAMLFRRKSDYSLRELFQGLLGHPVGRAENILTSHKGFQFRKVTATLANHFEIVDSFHSPLVPFPWWMNSQQFLVLRRSY